MTVGLLRCVWGVVLCLSLLVVPCQARQAAAVYRILDPLAVPITGEPGKAVIVARPPHRTERISCDVVIAGGGMGGVAAALAGGRAGLRICLTEETNWLGGQMTAQGVSALDENRWIETTGSTATYKQLRQNIRGFYVPFLPPGRSDRQLNPGACWVSALCFEPRAGLAAIGEMIAPYELAGRLRVMLRSVPVAVSKHGRTITGVLVYSFETHRFTRLDGRLFIDATELGNLLALSGAKFRRGAESCAETGEPDAPQSAHPDELQSFTYPFFLADGGNNGLTVSKPPDYNDMLHQFSFTVFGLHNTPLRYAMFARLPGTPGSFWTYRRLIDPTQFTPGSFPYSLSMINWEGNDTCDAGYLSPDALTAATALQHGKQIAMGFAWWLRNEAPHKDGNGRGFPELQLRSDLLSTADGLSQYPYIRESRRLIALKIVREQDLAEPWQPGVRAAGFKDSVGIGYYPIDIHGCGSRQQLPKSKPFQIPLGALMSQDMTNLLAGGKDLGTTHITNGAYRLHPTEWAVGEAAGALAAWAIQHDELPAVVEKNLPELRAFQRTLIDAGDPLVWFDDVPLNDPRFVAIQFLSLVEVLPLDAHSLHFRPEEPITGVEIATMLRRFSAIAGISLAIPPELEKIPRPDWRQMASVFRRPAQQKGSIERGDFAQWLLNWWDAVHPARE